MTIPASNRRMPAVATNGVQTVFAFDFRVFSDADVKVVFESAAGVESVLALSSDYTVSRNSNQTTSPGGTITAVIPPASGGELTILGALAYVQQVDVPNAGPFFGDTIENALDYLAILIQQTEEIVGRSLKVSAIDDSVAELPSALQRANRYLYFDTFGSPLPVNTVTLGAVVASAFGQNLVQAASAAAARTTLGATPVGDTVFTAADAAAARTAIGATIVNKNRIPNGNFLFDQRNNGAAVTVNTASEVRCQDCWVAAGAAAAGVFTVSQVATGGPTGSPNFCRLTVTTADAAPAAGAQYRFSALIEGLDIQDLGFGAAGALAISWGFWFRSSLAGPFSGSVRNAAGSRSYPVSWAYPVANVWQFVSLANIPGDVTGTWTPDNTRRMVLTYDVGSGSTARGSAGAWTAANILGVTGATRLMSTNGATMDIVRAQLEPGPVCTDYEWMPYANALMRVRRYFRAYRASSAETNAFSWAGQVGLGNGVWNTVHFDTPMRASPSVDIAGAVFNFSNLGTPTVQYATPVSATLQFVGTFSGGGSANITSGQVTVAAEL